MNSVWEELRVRRSYRQLKEEIITYDLNQRQLFLCLFSLKNLNFVTLLTETGYCFLKLSMKRKDEMVEEGAGNETVTINYWPLKISLELMALCYKLHHQQS